MLILSRKVGESVVLIVGGEKVVVTINNLLDGNKVVLGVDATSTIRVNRREVQEEINRGRVEFVARSQKLKGR